MTRTIYAAAAGLVALATALATPARADTIPYPGTGTPNSATYTFTAAGTGNVVAYYYEKSGAGYEEQLGLWDVTQSKQIGDLGLDNKTSTAGEALTFGSVNAGDVLEFFIKIINGNPETGDLIYSNPSANSDGVQHIYSTSYAGGNGIPTGTYVGFEDLLAPNSPDYNYTDEEFVFTNAAGLSNTGEVIGAVPEPTTLALLGTGLLGLAARHSRRTR